jgi:hypothetical protein
VAGWTARQANNETAMNPARSGVRSLEWSLRRMPPREMRQ